MIRRILWRLRRLSRVRRWTPPGLRGRGSLRPEVEEPGLDHASRRLEDLRVVAPQLLSHAVRQANAVPGEFLGDPGPCPEFDDDRVDRVDPPEVVKIGPQRVGEDAGVEAVVLGAAGREAVAEPVELLRVDRVDREPPVHEALDDRPVRDFDRHRNVRSGPSGPGGPRGHRTAAGRTERATVDPIGHLGQPHASVAEDAFLPLRAVAADHVDVMRFRCPVHAGEPGLGFYHAPSRVKVSLDRRGFAAMPANPCTGARWRELPTGHPSRLPGRGTTPL